MAMVSSVSSPEDHSSRSRSFYAITSASDLDVTICTRVPLAERRLPDGQPL
ncbi:Hypothetical predicted protein, partial [Marmota monax]